MKPIHRFLHNSSNHSTVKLLLLSVVAVFPLAAMGYAGDSKDSIGISNAPIPDIKYSDIFTPADQADYDLECAGREPSTVNGNGGIQVGKILGDLVIDTPLDVEQKKCITEVTGNLTIRAYKISTGQYLCSGNCLTMEYMNLPWLRKVGGNLYLRGNHEMKKPRLPRLKYIGGKIYVGSIYGPSGWVFNSLTSHSNTLKADSVNGAKLSGFKNLSYLKRLELLPKPLNVNYGPYWSGLQNLATLGSLKIHSQYASASNNFLNQLNEISGTTDINVRSNIYGLDNVQIIGGDLEISTYQGNSFDGLESLQQVGGSIEWSPYSPTINSLHGLQNLTDVGGDMELPLYVSSLTGLENLNSVGGDFTLTGYIGSSGNLSKLSGLTKVGGTFTIEDVLIETLDGLNNVTELGGLQVSNNSKLGNVSALGNATMLGNGSVTIANNNPLTTCQASSLISMLTANSPGWNGNTTVTGNQPCYYFKRFPSATFR